MNWGFFFGKVPEQKNRSEANHVWCFKANKQTRNSHIFLLYIIFKGTVRHWGPDTEAEILFIDGCYWKKLYSNTFESFPAPTQSRNTEWGIHDSCEITMQQLQISHDNAKFSHEVQTKCRGRSCKGVSNASSGLEVGDSLSWRDNHVSQCVRVCEEGVGGGGCPWTVPVIPWASGARLQEANIFACLGLRGTLDHPAGSHWADWLTADQLAESWENNTWEKFSYLVLWFHVSGDGAGFLWQTTAVSP